MGRYLPQAGFVWARAGANGLKSWSNPRRCPNWARTGQTGLAHSNPTRAPARLPIWVMTVAPNAVIRSTSGIEIHEIRRFQVGPLTFKIQSPKLSLAPQLSVSLVCGMPFARQVFG